MKHRLIRSHEALAIAADSIHSGIEGGRKAIWWDLGPPIRENEVTDDGVAVVYVQGPLEHHPDILGDSYEAVCKRADEAFDCSDAKCVVLRIDSPGGVVSGLNEAVRALREMSVTHEKPLYAYIDELGASAAYALACSAEAIFLPKSAIAGSIGVISTMFDQVAADQMMGLNFQTLSSGERKADGHPHVAISTGAIEAEQRRVKRLAKQFFRLVADVRPLSINEVKAYEAGIFLGQEAVAKGLADDVLTWPELLQAIGGLDNGMESASPEPNTPASRGNETDRKAAPTMLVTLRAQIKRAEKQLASAKGEAERSALRLVLANLQSAVAAFEAAKKIKHKEIEHTEEHTDDDEDKDKDGDDGDEDDAGDEEETAAKGEDDEEASASEEEEEANYEEDEKKAAKKEEGKKAAFPPEKKKGAKKAAKRMDEEEEAAALLSVARAHGVGRAGALAARLAQAREVDTLRSRINALETTSRREKLTERISAKLAGHFISRPQAKMLAGKMEAGKLTFVSEYLNTCTRPMVVTSEDDLLVPSADPRTGDALPPEVDKAINEAMVVMGEGKNAEQRKALRADLVAAQKRRMNGAAAGRY